MSYTHDQQPESLSNEVFGEVISTYTDAQAVGDGFLVAIAGPGNVNRVTGRSLTTSPSRWDPA